MAEKICKRLKNNNKHMSLHIIIAFCLMLLPFDMLSFINGSASATSENMVEYNLNNEEEASPPVSTEDIQKSLWRINITPAKEEQEQVQKDELQYLIEQINAMEFSLPSQVSEPNVVDEKLPEQTNRTISESASNTQKVKNISFNNSLYEPLTEQTIQKLKKLAEKPEKIDNPYEIGNTLYLSNCIGEAAVFYQEALRRNKPDDMSSSEDRAWLLFQTGNSLQVTDMQSAADVYKKLITEFPESPWADIARIQSNVITWYAKDKPDELLTEYKR